MSPWARRELRQSAKLAWPIGARGYGAASMPAANGQPHPAAFFFDHSVKDGSGKRAACKALLCRAPGCFAGKRFPGTHFPCRGVADLRPRLPTVRSDASSASPDAPFSDPLSCRSAVMPIMGNRSGCKGGNDGPPDRSAPGMILPGLAQGPALSQPVRDGTSPRCRAEDRMSVAIRRESLVHGDPQGIACPWRSAGDVYGRPTVQAGPRHPLRPGSPVYRHRL